MIVTRARIQIVSFDAFVYALQCLHIKLLTLVGDSVCPD